MNKLPESEPIFGHQNFFQWGDQWMYTLHRAKVDINSKLDILELGTGTGSASYWIANNLLNHKDSTLTTVDHFVIPNQYAKAVHNLSICNNAEKIKLISQRVEKFVFSDHANYYDIIYVDAAHQLNATLYNMYFSEKHLKPGGIMFLDDMHIDEIQKAVSHIKNNWTLIEIDTGFEHQTAYTKELQ